MGTGRWCLASTCGVWQPLQCIKIFVELPDLRLAERADDALLSLLPQRQGAFEGLASLLCEVDDPRALVFAWLDA